MLHFVTSNMKQNSSRKQTLESAHNELEISFNSRVGSCTHLDQVHDYSGEIDVAHNLKKADLNK